MNLRDKLREWMRPTKPDFSLPSAEGSPGYPDLGRTERRIARLRKKLGEEPTDAA